MDFLFDAIHKDLLDPKSPIEAAKGFWLWLPVPLFLILHTGERSA
jgi:hypothetical protein